MYPFVVIVGNVAPASVICATVPADDVNVIVSLSNPSVVVLLLSVIVIAVARTCTLSTTLPDANELIISESQFKDDVLFPLDSVKLMTPDDPFNVNRFDNTTVIGNPIV